MTLPPDLEQAVSEQSQARVEMSIQGYAKYLTPQAIVRCERRFRASRLA